jgi:Ca2+-binding EF-hand superfamily protein
VDESIQRLMDDLQFRAETRGETLVRSRSLDLDGDGRVSWEEYQRVAAARYRTGLGAADRNGDGDVSLEEFLQQRRSGRILIAYREMDADRNGRIDAREFESFNAQLFAGLTEKLGGGKGKPLTLGLFQAYHRRVFDGFDANRDGFIDRGEVSARPRAAVLPLVMPEWKKLAPFVSICDVAECAPLSFYLDDEGPQPDPCQSPNPPGYCPDTGHPGCTVGDVRSGNCVEIWEGFYAPFF